MSLEPYAAAEDYGDLEPVTREQRMAQMRLAGKTLEQIGREFGVSRERVRQILRDAGGPTRSDVNDAKRKRQMAIRDRLRRDVEESVRPLLAARGPMSALEVAEHTGLHVEIVAEHWPTDLVHMRIRETKGVEQTWADDEIYESLREAAIYEFPLTAKGYSDLLRVGQVRGPSLQRINQRFGGWANACEGAGVEHGGSGRSANESRWTDNELLAFVRDYLVDPDWPNSSRHFDEWKRANAPDAPSFQTLRNRLGSWTKAKRAALRPERTT